MQYHKRRRLKEGVTYARIQNTTRYHSIARRPDTGAGGESTGRSGNRRSAGLPLWLLRILRPMPAHPWAFMGRDSSTTGSSSAWVPGPAGAMLTAGANIASSMQAEAVITDAAAMKPIMAIGPTAITTMITTAIITAVTTVAHHTVAAHRMMAGHRMADEHR